jgi:hypothetical protein
MAASEPPTIHLEPLETSPEQIVVFDRTARRWTVRLSNTGLWVGLPRPVPGLSRWSGKGPRVIAAFDPRHDCNLSDCLQWGARIAEPRQLNLDLEGGPGRACNAQARGLDRLRSRPMSMPPQPPQPPKPRMTWVDARPLLAGSAGRSALVAQLVPAGCRGVAAGRVLAVPRRGDPGRR